MSHLHIISDGDFSTLALDMQAQFDTPDKYWRTFFHYENAVFDIIYHDRTGFRILLSNAKQIPIYVYHISEDKIKSICDEMLVESIHES